PRLVPGLRLRDDVKPLEITQPEGTSFTLDGQALRWQRWSMRLGFNYREGLVIHTLGYEDGGRVRPVAHRLSFAEMVVPYRDPTPDHYRRTAFDIGEWGLGFMTTSLERGCDCLGEIAYLDAALHDTRGEPYGTLVDERTYAPTHQHFLVARLDMDIDGEDNTVYATESEALPTGPENPHGLAVVQRSTPLRTEAEGRQDYDWHAQRSWKVVNDGVTSRLGTPVGYKLVPGACIPALLDRDSPVFRRAQVLGHTLWVTPYREDERWPCGEFPNQSAQDTGLAAW